MHDRFESRRTTLATLLSAGALAALIALPVAVAAQTFPEAGRQIIIVNPYPPGALGDILSRQMAPKLGESLGTVVIVENKPGANGAIGLGEVARSRPDGHMVAIVPMSTLTINPWLYKDLPYQSKQLTPITTAMTLPNVLVVHPSVPANTLAEFIDYLRKNPNRVNFASQGNGSSGHLMGELFKMHAKVDITHVPYKGGSQALVDLMAGNVQMMFDNVGSALPHIKAGRLKGLAVSTTAPSPQAPELPPIANVISGFDGTIWYGFVGPAGIPPATAAKLNEHFVKALRSAEIVKAFEARGVTIVGSPQDALGKLIETDLERWGKVVREARISIQ